MADTDSATPESTPVADKRDDTTDQTVTELKTIDGTDSDKDLKAAAGITGKLSDAAPQQVDAYQGMKDAHANAKDPTKPVNPQADAIPFAQGPGSDIA